MKILVTGGDGFVGRYLCHHLSANHNVHILDNFRFESDEKRYYRDQNITIHRCDIREFSKVEEVISGVNPEIVFHLAAIPYIPECEKAPDEAIATNVIGTVNLLRALKENTRVIFASSGAVYAPDEKPRHEDTSLVKPTDVYGSTKLHGEYYVNYFARLKRLKTTIVRLFNVIGPGETNPHLLPVIIGQLLKGNRTIRLGNVKPKRDYIYVQDAIDGFAAVGFMDENDIKGGEILNLGTSQNYSVEEIVAMLSRIIGEKIIIEVDPKRVRETDMPFLCADISKIINITDWRPKYSIQAALEATWKNPEFRIPYLEEV